MIKEIKIARCCGASTYSAEFDKLINLRFSAEFKIFMMIMALTFEGLCAFCNFFGRKIVWQFNPVISTAQSLLPPPVPLLFSVSSIFQHERLMYCVGSRSFHSGMPQLLKLGIHMFRSLFAICKHKCF